MEIESASGQRASRRQLAALLGARRGRVALIALATVAAVVPTVVVPPLIGAAVGAVERADRDALELIALGLAGAGLLAAIAVAARTLLAQRLALDIESGLRARLFERVLVMPLDELDRTGGGDLLARATVDLRLLRVILGGSLPAALQGLAVIAGVACVMVAVNPVLAVFALAPVPLIAALGARYAASLRAADYETRTALGDVAAQAQEDIAGIGVIKGFALESQRSARFHAAAERVRAAAVHASRIQARFGSVLAVLPGLGMLAVLLYGGLLASRTEGGIGDPEFVTFFMYVVLLVSPAQQVGWILGTGQTAAAAATRVLELLGDEGSEAAGDRGGDGPEPDGGALRMRDVSAARGAEPAIAAVDIDVGPGELEALAGRPGAGKTTVLELADRLRDPERGRIEVGGAGLAEIPERALRSSVALLTDPPALFAGTIRENIAMGRPDAELHEVEEAARLAAADAFIRRLPGGYDAALGSGGTSLSGGQRQRIALARALLLDPDLLLLDNPTGALDRPTELEVLAGLGRGRGERATLAVSPRPELLAAADRITVMEAGRVKARGDAAGLAAAHPEHAALIGGAGEAAGRPDELGSQAGDPAPPGPAKRDSPPTPRLSLRNRLAAIGGLLAGEGRTVALGVAATLAGLAMTIVPPYLGARAVDDVARADDSSGLLVLCAVLLAVLVLGAVAVAVQIVELTAAGQSVLARLRIRVLDHLLALPMRYFDRVDGGTLVSRATNDVEALDQLLIGGLSVLVSSLLTIIVTTAVLLALDVELAVIACVVVPLALLATAVFSRRMSAAYHAASDALAAMTSFLAEAAAGMASIRAYGRGEAWRERFGVLDAEIRNHLAATVTLQAGYVGAIELLAGLALAGIVLLGGDLAIDGTITVGILVAFATYLRAAIGPIPSLVGLYDIYAQGMAGLDHVLALLEEPAPERPRAGADPPRDGSLEMRGVWFAYEDRDFVLEDVSISIPAGASVALVGPTGAGKSTLVKLLLGLYEPDRGEIALGGVDLRSAAPRSLHELVGYVAQEPFLFAGTVWENIAFASAEPELEEAREAARGIGVLTDLEALPDGLETRVGEGGRGLSAGQRQLVALARATLGDRPILVLDEPTSSIDAATEAAIGAALASLRRERTTITIAHRISTVERVDRIFVVDGGRIAASGTHGELLAAGGLYARLCG